MAARVIDEELGFSLVPETVFKDGSHGTGSVQKWEKGVVGHNVSSKGLEKVPKSEWEKLENI